ncbi:MAG: hypothetical protein ACRD88_21595 [Terriglobia bacterium]
MGFETRLVLTNPSSAPARVVLTARGDDGSLLRGNEVRNPVTVDVPAYRQVASEVGPLFGLAGTSLHLGWVQAESDNAQLMALLSASTTAQASGAGIEATSQLGTSLVGPIPARMQAAIALANPNSVPAEVVVRLYDVVGRERRQSTFILPAQGHRAEFLSDGSGGLADEGHFEVVSTVGLSGMTVLTGTSGYTLAPLGPPSSQKLVFPRVVNGESVGMTLVLMNASAVGVVVRWRAYDAQGVLVWGEASSVIPPHGTVLRNVGELFVQGNDANFDGSVEAEVVATTVGVFQGIATAGLAVSVEATGVSSMPAQNPITGPAVLSVGGGPALAGSDRGAGWLVNAGTTLGIVNLLAFGANGQGLGGRTLEVPAGGRVSLDGVVPAGTELALFRGTVPMLGYQAQTDGSGVRRAQGARAVPQVVSGTVPLTKELGGMVVAADARASVDVPLDALEQDTVVAIETLGPTNSPTQQGLVLLSVVRVGPLGLRLRVPARLEMPVLTSARLPEGTRLQVYDPAAGRYRETPYEVFAGVGGRTLVTMVDQFPAGPTGTVWAVWVPLSGIGVFVGP